MVVTAGVTENPLPVPTKVPPHEPVYHCITSFAPPPPPLSVKVVLLPIQMGFVAAVAEVGSVDFAFTVIDTDAHAEL